MNVKQIVGMGVLALGLTLTAAIAPQYIKASDHDDGEVTTKGRNRNLTDLLVFREKDQNPNRTADDLVFIMNTNPRSLPRQQYYFSPTARYEFHVTRVADKDATPTGKEDVVLRFEFESPDSNGQQQFKLTAIANGTTRVARGGKTTPLAPDPAVPPVINQLRLGNSTLTAFAGLREDSFFFDVTRYFQVRAGALGIGPVVEGGFRSPERAVDFTKQYNVNSIVVRVPRSFLQGSNPDVKTFDVWETISVKSPVTGEFSQFERLARPVINEGLIVTNAFLNAFNRIPPSADLSPAAAPVRAEALKTLQAFGNTPAEARALATAFLPDVMRIDTTGPSGYGNALNAQGSPIRGRLLEDDVVDITLNLVTKGAIKTDNVSYKGEIVQGVRNPAQGHSPLQPNFPYLALPN